MPEVTHLLQYTADMQTASWSVRLLLTALPLPSFSEYEKQREQQPGGTLNAESSGQEAGIGFPTKC